MCVGGFFGLFVGDFLGVGVGGRVFLFFWGGGFCLVGLGWFFWFVCFLA